MIVDSAQQVALRQQLQLVLQRLQRMRVQHFQLHLVRRDSHFLIAI
jgi:hypothetical protein